MNFNLSEALACSDSLRVLWKNQVHFSLYFSVCRFLAIFCKTYKWLQYCLQLNCRQFAVLHYWTKKIQFFVQSWFGCEVEPVVGDSELMQDLLRVELGFRAVLETDWFGYGADGGTVLFCFCNLFLLKTWNAGIHSMCWSVGLVVLSGLWSSESDAVKLNVLPRLPAIAVCQ